MLLALALTLFAALCLVIFASFCVLGKRPAHSSGALLWVSSALALAASVAGLALGVVSVSILGGSFAWALLVAAVVLTLGSVFVLWVAYISTSFPQDLSGH